MLTSIPALVVRHLSCECILGVDWQLKHRLDICHSARDIRLHDENGRCLTSRRMNDNMSSTQFSVKLIASISLQPYQECQVQASVPISSSPAVLFLPRRQLQNNKTIRTPDAVLSIDNYVISLTIYNDSDRRCHLATGTLLDVSINAIDDTNGCLPDDVKTTIMSATSHIVHESQRQALVRLLKRYSNLLNTSTPTLAETSMNHAIRTYDHAAVTTKPYPQSQQQRIAMEHHVENMLQAKQIRLSNSPWSSPALLVAKPDGSTRFVVDFRKLNQISVKYEYPLPNIEDTLNQLAGCSFFTKSDLKAGYLQLPIREEDKEKTAFKTKDGLFEFNVLAPGLKNAPPSFQRIMDAILVHGRSTYCLVHVDDHSLHVETILGRHAVHKFQLNPMKCWFFLQAMDYLGHHISGQGMSPLNDKINAIME